MSTHLWVSLLFASTWYSLFSIISFFFFSFSSSSYTRISPSVTDPTWPVLIGALEHPAKIYAKHALAVSTAIFAFFFAKRKDAQAREIKLKTDLQVIYSPILVKCRTSFWFFMPILTSSSFYASFLWSSQANKIIALYVCRCDLHFNFERGKREREIPGRTLESFELTFIPTVIQNIRTRRERQACMITEKFKFHRRFFSNVSEESSKKKVARW